MVVVVITVPVVEERFQFHPDRGDELQRYKICDHFNKYSNIRYLEEEIPVYSKIYSKNGINP